MIGTMNILAACSGPDSPVRKVVFKSSAHYYGCEQDDPAFFTEAMRRPHPPRTPHRARHRRGREGRAPSSPSATRDVDRDRRCASPTGSARTCAPRHTALLSLPAVPMILGFDPRYQFIHEDDIVGVLEHAVARRAARASTTRPPTACSCCRRSARLLGKPLAPMLPPWGTGLAAAPLRRARPEDPARDAQPAALRPRARQPQAEGAGCRCATPRARRVQALAEHLRMRRDARAARRAVPLRARSRGVPALEPERAARRRVEPAPAESPRARPCGRQTCSASSGYRGPRSTIVRH